MTKIPIFFYLDASKFLSQSQARLSSSVNPNDAPLFYSAAEFNTDEDDSNPSSSRMAGNDYSLAKTASRYINSSVYGPSTRTNWKSSFKNVTDRPMKSTRHKHSYSTGSVQSSSKGGYGISEEDSEDIDDYNENSSNDDTSGVGDEEAAILSPDKNSQKKHAKTRSLFNTDGHPLESSASTFDETPRQSIQFNNQTLEQAGFNIPEGNPITASHNPPDFLSRFTTNSHRNRTPPSYLLSSKRSVSSELESIQLTQELSRNHGMNNSINNPEDEEPPDDLAIDQEYTRQKQQQPLTKMFDPLSTSGVLPGVSVPFDPSSFLPQETTDLEAQIEDSQYLPPEVQTPPQDMPKYDAIWGNVYLGMVSSMLATSLMIWLRTDVPKSVPLGETMYTMLQKSGRFLFMDTLIASAASIAWIFLLKRYSITFFYISIVTVPVALLVLTFYPLAMSYRTTYGGNTTQDKAMRWTTLIPLTLAGLWCYFIYKGRNALNRALGIIKLASSILADNPPLILLAYASVGFFLIATWFWIHMFMRVFLQGHTVLNHGVKTWVLDPRTWALGAFYIFMYLWSWGVIAGFQRSTASAVVSQWYFYRNSLPQPSSSEMTYAALQYSFSTQFGTICLSSLLRLLVRLPLYVLPRRVIGFIQLAAYNIVPTSILSLTNPLALSNAIINSQNLVVSAQTISSMKYLDQGHNNPSVPHAHSWTAYRLSKMLLSAGRAIACLCLGYGAWIHAAMYNDGSLYAYMAGFIAGFIGWFVLGASEGLLSIIVDASFLCFAIDNSNRGGHCSEADRQFGGL